MINERQIIDGCARHDRKAQQLLYDKYSRFLLGICMRYVADKTEAEDILQECFLKVFFNIKDFSGTGSFPGWLRKIAVNTAITHYHKNLKFRYHIEIEEYVSRETADNSFDQNDFTEEELYRLLNELPAGYRMVFNLYAIEGYKHKEIAEMLGIDTNTSKSQYSRAKAVLREKLRKFGRLKDNYPGSEKDIENTVNE